MTIKELSELAGVSRGTVDRIIHNRGRVNPEVENRIKALMEQLNFSPNPTTRRLLIRKQQIKIGVISKTDQNGFWSIVLRSLNQTARPFEEFGITIEKRLFDYHFPENQVATIDELLEAGISALVIVPFNDPIIAEKLTDIQENKNIPVVLINSEVDGFEPFCYVGSDYHVSGRTAAGLIHNFSKSENLDVLVFKGSRFFTGHSLQLEGFLEEMKTYNNGARITCVDNVLAQGEYAYSVVVEHLKAHPEINAVLTIPSIGDVVAKAIRDLGKVGTLTHVTYGMTDATRPGIIDGSISAIIGSRAELQGSLPLDILFSYFLNGEEPKHKRMLMLNDIFIKQNSIFGETQWGS